MRDYTVAIYELTGDAYALVGTGFFLTPTLFATAAHVIRDCGRYLRLGDTYVEFQLAFCHYRPYESLESDDLAIGRLPSGHISPAVATLATDYPPMYAPCVVAGFRPKYDEPEAPWYHELRCEFNYDRAMRSPNRLALQGSRLQLNDGQLYSMSGGPIANETGEVIGLLTGGGLRTSPRGTDAPRLPEIQLWAVSVLHIAEILASLPQ
jgi:hypothetical protein